MCDAISGDLLAGGIELHVDASPRLWRLLVVSLFGAEKCQLRLLLPSHDYNGLSRDSAQPRRVLHLCAAPWLVLTRAYSMAIRQAHDTCDPRYRLLGVVPP
jgi:hypothetical protein